MASRKKPTRHKMGYQERRQKYANVRSDLSKLKAKGLISPKANLRKAMPSLALRKKAEILRPVLEGKAQAVRLPKATRADFKEAGYNTVRGQTIIPKNVNQKVKVNNAGRPEIIEYREGKAVKSPYTVIILPADVSNFSAFYKRLTDDPTWLQKMLGRDGYVGFTFWGHNSLEVGTAEWLADYLKHYQPLFGDHDDSARAFKHLVLYKIKADSIADWRSLATGDVKYYGKGNKTVQDRRQAKDKHKRTAMSHGEALARDRARKQAERAKIKQGFKI